MTMPGKTIRREHEEQRPKNAGVHKDQNKRNHSRATRRTEKQNLRLECGRR
jgi:hypothetical protein